MSSISGSGVRVPYPTSAPSTSNMVCSRYSSWQGRNCRLGRSRTNDRNFGVPAAHVAHAVLHGEHAGQRRNLELGLEIVGRLGRVRILKQDQRQAAFLMDGAIAVLGRALLVAEPQPAMRGIDEPS